MKNNKGIKKVFLLHLLFNKYVGLKKESSFFKILLFTIFLFLSNFIYAGSVNSKKESFGYPLKIVGIPKLSGDITVDGCLKEVSWSNAFKFPSFIQTAGNNIGKVAKYPTECYAFRNKNKLYVAFICYDPKIESIKANTTGWDDPDIIFDDRVEVFIDINHDHRNYYELAVNPKGRQLDRKLFLRFPHVRVNEANMGWNCKWKARTSIQKDKWIAEIEIDATTLGITKIEDGMTWGFNVARVRHPAIKKVLNPREDYSIAEYSAWNLTRDGIWETFSNFQEPIDFGDVVFGNYKINIRNLFFKNASFVFGGNNVPPSNVGINFLGVEFNSPVSSDKGLILHIRTQSRSKKVWEQKKIIETDGSNIFRTDFFIQESGESKLSIELLEKNTGHSIYKTNYVLTIPPFIDFDLSSLYLRENHKNTPVSYRLLTDQKTLNRSNLKIELKNDKNKLFADTLITDLTRQNDFQKIFNTDFLRKLRGGNYFFKSVLIDKNTSEVITSFVQPFTKFNIDPPRQFDAFEGNYQYGGMEGSAVQIHFSDGQKYVFWEKASNVPWWDVGQVALTYEFVESRGFSTQGCTEAMQDRRCKYSKVEIVEKSQARIVIHWRYALTDAHYKIHRNEWVDEYYYFYPDGVGTRYVNLWSNSNDNHEFFEIIPVNPPAMQGKDMFDGFVAKLSNFKGKAYTTADFIMNGEKFRESFFKSSEDFMIEVNLKNRYHPFAVFTYRKDINPGVSAGTISLCPMRKYSVANHRGHWPASEYEIDGYNLIGNHRPSHGNIGSIASKVDSIHNPNTFTVLIGITPENSDESKKYGLSWLNPGKIIPRTKSLIFTGYDVHQRAYCLKINVVKSTIKLDFIPERQKIKEPVLICEGLNNDRIKDIKIDGRKLLPGEYKTGMTYKQECIIYLNKTIKKQQKLEIILKK